MVLFDRRSHEDRRTGMPQPLMAGAQAHTYNSAQKR
jgi:hypothetical protein